MIMESYYPCMKACRDNFFFVLVFLFLIRSSAKSSDLQNLLSFKSSLPDPNILQNWQQGGNNPCSFTGVSCNNNSRVSSLDLSAFSISVNFNSVSTHLFSIEQLTSITLKSSNISNPLQPFSSCSPFLARIDLSNNFISGPFSDLSVFGSCSGLKHLNLSSNLLDNSKGFKGANFGLSSLETLDVSGNPLLVGEDVLPWVLSEGCAHLSHLSMRGNRLGGSFSLSGCTHLEHLDLSSNNFSIPIPNLGRDCPSLRYLNLSSNNFYGEFADIFAGLKSLEFIYLGSNQLQGVVPESFADQACSTLVELDLSNNNFSGMIPSDFESCSLLEIFDVSTNTFSGDLPVEIFLQMGNLKKLVLAFNNFKGTLPDNLSSMSNLEVLDLSSNYISGKIPNEICQTHENGGRTNLKELYLQNNLLTGPIPPTLGNCSQLVSLDLSVNYLSGKIPTTLGTLSKLKDLIMWMNQLEGSIPSELMYNQEIENLILDYNKLTGTIPSGLKNCTNLNWISLSSNQLHGKIPSWIGSLDNLAILKLSNNSFYGEIPPELGDCKSLLWLDLHSNELSGSLPSSLAKQSGSTAVGLVVRKKYAYLRNEGEYCHGTGNLVEFGGIRQEALDRIPTTNTCNFSRIFPGNTRPIFNHNGSMIFLDLSFNNLDGYIPKELGSMSLLSILNLGHNNLSGSIPLELGGLKYIDVLDLSYNQLSGHIPTSLGGLTFLTEIDLSNNELSGVLPKNGQFETFPPYRFYNNSGLCGYPFPSCYTSLSPQLAGDGSSPSNESDHDYFYLGLYVSIGFGFYVGFFGFFGTLALKDSWRDRYFRFLEHIIKRAYFCFVQHIINRVYVVVAMQVAKLQRNRENVAN